MYPESDGCLCPGDMVIYECTVVGGTTTVWKGSIVDDHCQNSNHELKLSHAHYNSSEETHISCDYGSIFGRIVGVENNTYTSQLIVNLTYSVTQKSIECIHDNGSSETSVGSINITLGMPTSITHLLQFCIQVFM